MKYPLMRSSQVCRAWLPASRYHLFGSVQLHSTPQFKKLCALVKASKLDRLPKPALYVRNLSILFYAQAYARVAFIRGDTFSVLNEPYRQWLLYSLPRMSNVENLRLYHVDFPHLPLDLRKTLSTFSFKLTSIALRHSLIGGPLYCQAFLRSFPNLMMIDFYATVSDYLAP